MADKPRTCFTCGKEYMYCPHCKEDKDKPTWMFVWDTFECKTVFNILSRYNSKNITKEEARKELDKVLTHSIKFTDKIENEIKEIYKDIELKPATKSKSKRIVTEN